MVFILRISCCKSKHYFAKFISFHNKCFRNYSIHRNAESIDIEFHGRSSLNISTGKYARFADGCAVAQLGDTSVLVTAVSKTKLTLNSFLPLVVDYRQKAAAAGRIPTNFFRREGGPSEQEILTSRVIDRSLRPLFPKNYLFDTQIMCNLLAVDSIHDADVLSINAASAALSLSDIPWNGPIGAVRVGLCDNEVVINPTRREQASSTLNLIISATSQNLVVMIEGSADNVYQQDFLKAIKLGVKECQKIVSAISQMQKAYGRPKRTFEAKKNPEQTVTDSVKAMCEFRLREVLQNYTHDKISRDEAVQSIQADVLEKLKDGMYSPPDKETLSKIFGEVYRDIFRNLIFETNLRCDGRQMDQLRDISCEVDLYKPLHGSALFQRGQTQVLCTVALDSIESAMKTDPISMLLSLRYLEKRNRMRNL